MLLFMDIIKLNKTEYILGDKLLEHAPIYCKSCRSIRELVRKKKITDKYFIYARFDENKWKQTNGKSLKYDKILLLKEFVDKINEIKSDSISIDENGIELAPDIIELYDDEKFKDDNNNILEIETRGKRKYDKIYFKVKDVSDKFGFNRLDKIIIDKRNSYEINKHYKYFNCKSVVTDDINVNKIKKVLFLTYRGILRLLYTTKNKKTENFIDWTTEKLFTIHMGSKDDKINMVSDILGVPAKTINDVFNKNINTIPCVYFFTIGKVKDLRNSMKIDEKYDDNMIIGKFGFTDNLERRTNEHIRTYKKIKNTELKLKYYVHVDPQYTSEAESYIKKYIDDLDINFKFENTKELIIITEKQLNHMKLCYEHISKEYSGHIKELLDKIKELTYQLEKQEMKHQFELKQQEANHEKELLKKEIEYLKLIKNK